MAKFCFFLQISFVLLEFPSHFPQNLFPSNFLHFAKKSFQKEISFKVEALVSLQVFQSAMFLASALKRGCHPPEHTLKFNIPEALAKKMATSYFGKNYLTVFPQK
jgi:hypothetical protein